MRGDLIMPGDPGHDDEPQAEQPDTGQRRWAVLAVVSAAQFLIILDLWVVNIALPALQHDFAPATLSDVSWILDVYAIVLAALLLPAGRAADSIGRRACFLAGLVVFGIASLGCAVAPASVAVLHSRDDPPGRPPSRQRQNAPHSPSHRNAPAQSPQRRPSYGSYNTHSGAERMTALVTRLPRRLADTDREAVTRTDHGW